MRRALVLLLLVAGCRGPLDLPAGVTLRCGEDADCPDDRVCAQGACANPDDPCLNLAARAFLDDGESCGVERICVRGLCVEAGCGDGFVAEGEECDEGADNADAPNACRTTCVSPSCGDGIVDSNDESCDGGEDCEACIRLCPAAGLNCNFQVGDFEDEEGIADGCECAARVEFPFAVDGTNGVELAASDTAVVALYQSGIDTIIDRFDIASGAREELFRLENFVTGVGRFEINDEVVLVHPIGFERAFVIVDGVERELAAEPEVTQLRPEGLYAFTDEALELYPLDLSTPTRVATFPSSESSYDGAVCGRFAARIVRRDPFRVELINLDRAPDGPVYTFFLEAEQIGCTGDGFVVFQGNDNVIEDFVLIDPANQTLSRLAVPLDDEFNAARSGIHLGRGFALIELRDQVIALGDNLLFRVDPLGRVAQLGRLSNNDLLAATVTPGGLVFALVDDGDTLGLMPLKPE